MQKPQGKPLTPKQRFAKLDGMRSSVMSRCEDYARWTLPYLLPRTGLTQSTELVNEFDSIGARLVNNLGNKVVKTLYNPAAPFFRIKPTPAVSMKLNEMVGAEAPIAEQQMDSALGNAERQGVDYLMRAGFRDVATLIALHLIVLGNALQYIPELENNKPKQVRLFNFRDWVVRRDVTGTVVELLIRESKAYGTFKKEVQEALQSGSQKVYHPDTNVTIYTWAKLNSSGKYEVTQHAEDVKLDTGAVYSKEDMPWTVLTWRLLPGEDYGRGSVEDYSGYFNAASVITEALTTGAAIACDIKFLVDPSSMLEVEDMNSAPSGSFHVGKKDDVTCVQLDKQLDFQLAQSLLERIERDLSQVFLVSQVRDAERVTKYEIWQNAMELEQGLGGVYSHLAREWQYPTAILALKRINFDPAEGVFECTIVTGMDTLTRQGDLENILLFLQDMQILNTVPEDVRGEIDIGRLLAKLATSRGVNFAEFQKTAAQKQEAMRQQQIMQQQELGAQVDAQVAVEAGKQSFKE